MAPHRFDSSTVVRATSLAVRKKPRMCSSTSSASELADVINGGGASSSSSRASSPNPWVVIGGGGMMAHMPLNRATPENMFIIHKGLLRALVPVLRFAVGPGSFADEHGEVDREKFAVSRRDAARRLITAVDATLLARRAAGEGNDVDVMEIALVYSSVDKYYVCSYGMERRYYLHDHRHEADITLSRVDSWLCFAEHHVKGSFTLELPLVAPVAAAVAAAEARRAAWLEAKTASVTDEGEVIFVEHVAPPADVEEEEEEIDVEVVELPRSTRAEVMSLTLGYATVSVPDTGAFRALTDFTLHHAVLDAGSGDDDLRLGHLLSHLLRSLVQMYAMKIQTVEPVSIY
uniref:Uncharacterized protein n=1 Tax=Oryza barthii TaxID=65489 RepID=A0A0D3HV52_9ORYZ